MIFFIQLSQLTTKQNLTIMIQKQISIVVFFIFIFSTISYSQATCLTAVPVTPGTQQCGSSQGQVGDFPNDGTAPNNPCASFYNDDEYWFSIVGDGINAIQVDLTNITQTYAGVFILDDCPANSPNCVTSVDNGSTTADLTVVTPTPLANGTTYYIVITSWGLPDWTDFCLDVTLTTPPPPPSNDSCANAIAMMPNPDNSCSMVTSGTNFFATESMTGCIGTANDDVWFSFVATNAIHSVDLLNVVAIGGSSTDMVHEVFSGTCGAFTSLSCNDPNSSTLTGLTVGDTYYIRVYSYFSSNNQSFDVCVGTPPPPPSNDECLNAIKVTANPTDTCGIVMPGTTDSATQSQTGCIGTANNDVWFSFDALDTTHTIDLLNIVPIGGTSTDMVHEVFSGLCGGLTSISCSDPNTSTVNGLVIGDTYFVRVYSYFTSSNQSFDICIRTPGPPPPPPANDECLNAVQVTPNSTDTCVVVTSGATTSATMSMAGCAGTANDDVWFSFNATSANHAIDLLNVVPTLGSSTDMVHEVFSGTCPTLMSISCSDPNTSTLNGLTVGATYYIRVYSYFSSSSQSFDLCIRTPAPPPPPPANDLCANSDTLNLQNGGCTTWSTYTNASATDSGAMPAPSCGAYGGGDLWFEVTVPASGAVTFEVQNVMWSNASATLYSGTCGALVEETCVAFNTEWPIQYVGSPGTLYLRVYDYLNNDVGTFDLCAYTPGVCAISNTTAGAQTACDTTNGFYTQEIIVDHNATSGTLDINGQQFPITTSPQTVVLTGLVADGLPVTANVGITGTVACTFSVTDLFTAPVACYILPLQNCGTYSNSPGLAIADLTTVYDTISVSTGMILSKLSVVVQIDHSYLGDINLSLIGPAGDTVDLMQSSCGTNEDMEIEYSDFSGPITCATPTVGYFQPVGNLSDFNGQPFDGDWVLTIYDDANGDQGILNQWCLLPDLLLTTEENIEETSLQLYPNPVSDILTVSTDLNLDQLEIWSMDGKRILHQPLNDFNSNIELNVDHLVSGVYVIRLRSDQKTIEKRFVKLQ